MSAATEPLHRSVDPPLPAERSGPSGPDSAGIVNAMTIDIEDYFQVEAFAATIDRAIGSTCRGGSSATPDACWICSPRPRCRRRFLPWAGLRGDTRR